MVALVAALVALLGVTTASATRIVAGNLILEFTSDFKPKKLPRHHDAPISFWGQGKLLTRDGSIPPPVTEFMAEFDRYGHVETRGLAKCTKPKLIATTSKQARSLCPGAIVGTGFGKAVIDFPEQAPIPGSSPITIFNGPEIGGDPTVIIHSHLTVPTPTTYLATARIRHIDNGLFDKRIEVDVPAIAGGHGSVVFFRYKVGRTWTFKGEKLSYAYARCPIGRLQQRVEVQFSDGTDLRGSLFLPCQAREE